MKRFTFMPPAQDAVDEDNINDVFIQYGNEFIHIMCYSTRTFAQVMNCYQATHNVINVEELTILIERRP